MLEQLKASMNAVAADERRRRARARRSARDAGEPDWLIDWLGR